MSTVTPSAAPRISSAFALAARQFPRHRAAMAGFAFLVLIALAAILAPWVSPFDPVQIKLSAKLKPPSLEHWLGTDHFGRDIFSRLIWGARTSLSVGILVVAFAFSLGVPLGLTSGYLGGRVDNLLMRMVDAFLTFPPLLLAVALVGLLGPEIQNVMLALGLVQAPVLARIVRGSTLAVREDVYVTAARALGAPTTRIVLAHILRNVVSPIVVQLTVVFSAAVVSEASLSFLGFGTQPPQPSWGRDMSEARRFLGDAPWMFMAPTGIIVLCVLSINFMGDGLRDALDPRAWRTRRRLAEGEG
ncbi:ABC transporter permease [Reyranella sp.]|uniref:ABC transporter permease n=1 Tax=Reyranella sp. TaxID=1929291 RepID=UPI003BAD0F90